MPIDASDAHAAGLFGRAGLRPPAPQLLEQLHEACSGADGYIKAALEVSLVRGPDGSDASEALLVLMRESVSLVTFRKRGMFKAATPPEHTMAFVWKSGRERERIRGALLAAKHGQFGRWGLHHLDPANYVEDFDRYYAIVVSEGPKGPDGWHEWVQERFGDVDGVDALGLAMEWRRCEIDDATRPWMPSRRVGRLGLPLPWIDTAPDAKRVLVRLAAQLYDEGLLGPPYDERSFNTGEPITSSDAGPARLVALMRLAGQARAIGHPRAAEWAAAAREGIPAVPSSAIPPILRSEWQVT